MADEASSDAERLRKLAPATRSNSQGFFQLPELAPGTFDLVFKAEGRATQRISDVSVHQNEETHLRSDVVLQPLATAALWLDPPTGPEETPWVVTLTPEDQRGSDETTGRSEEKGRVVFENLIPGDYAIRIESPNGDVYWRGVENLEDEAQVPIEIPLVEIIGRVTLDDEPVLGRVQLQAGTGDSIELETDHEGQIHGWARSPEYDFLQVEVAGVVPEFSRRLILRDLETENGVLRLDLEFEGRELRGIVRAADGRPVRDAQVDIREGDRFIAKAHTDVEGSFAFLALEPKLMIVSASHRSLGTSDEVILDLGQMGESPFLELSLHRRASFTGKVTTASGQGVAGASITLTTVGPAPTQVTQPTDLEGNFFFRLHPKTEAAIVWVAAPSHGLWFGCRSLSPETPLSITLPEGTGTLEIHTRFDPSLPLLATGGELLFSSDLGLADGSSLLRWMRMGGGEIQVDRENGMAVETIENLAAGAYALGWNHSGLHPAVASTCRGGPPPGLEWITLAPGGTAVLEFDQRPFQRASGPQ